jgi:hypothetical protein
MGPRFRGDERLMKAEIHIIDIVQP